MFNDLVELTYSILVSGLTLCSVAGPRSETTLGALTKRYEAYGLPYPPAGYVPVMVTTQFPGTAANITRTIPPSGRIGFADPARSSRPIYLGFGPPQKNPYRRVAGIADDPAITHKLGSQSFGSDSEACIVEAAQLEHAGLHRLAAAVLAMKASSVEGFSDQAWPRDPMIRLHTAAWHFWAIKAAQDVSRRPATLARLQSFPGLDGQPLTATEKSLLDSLTATIKSHPSDGDGYDRLLDGLTTTTGVNSIEFPPLIYVEGMEPQTPRALRKIWLAGFEAVPALLRHRDDSRLTALHSLVEGYPEVGTGFTTIGQVATAYLEALRAADAAFTLGPASISDPSMAQYVKEERGRVRRDETVWWAKARKLGERAYLLQTLRHPPKPGFDTNSPAPSQFSDTITPVASSSITFSFSSEITVDGSPMPDQGYLLGLLAKKHPSDAVRLYRHAHGTKAAGFLWVLARSLPASWLSHIRGTLRFNPSDMTNAEAYAALIKQGDPHAQHVLLNRLRALPPRPLNGDYLHSGAGNLALVVASDRDPRAWAALEAAIRKSDVEQRIQMITMLCYCGVQEAKLKRAELVAKFLTDTAVRHLPKHGAATRTAPEYGAVSVQNMAARSLGFLLGYSEMPSPTWTEREWAPFRKQVGADVAVAVRAGKMPPTGE